MSVGCHSRVALSRFLRREAVFVAALLVVLFGLSFTSHSQKPFASAEVRFTDASARGLSIVPASCPSDPHFAGDCGVIAPVALCPNGGIPGFNGLCPSGGGGGGGSGCPTGQTLQNGQCAFTGCPAGTILQNSQCVPNACPTGSFRNGFTCAPITCPSGWTLQGNDCIPPPSISFTPFDATSPTGGFSSDGHLKVFPVLVRSGNSAQVYWSVSNAGSCAITGTNGDSWTGASSGPGGKTSRPITSQTVFTLSCKALLGALPPSVQESQTVNVVPVFQER